MMLFCKLVIPVVDAPDNQKRRDAGVTQLRELRELLLNSELPIYFQADEEASTTPLAFHSLESLIKVAESVLPHSADEGPAELIASFLLHAPLMKALEIIGLGQETAEDTFILSPLYCTPEGERIASGRSSG